MSSPSNHQRIASDCAPVVWVRSKTADPFEGLKGHEYIEARKLSPLVQRVQTSAHAEQISPEASRT